MARRNYTREILAQIEQGLVPVNSLGPESRVQYAPRRKTDPQPWTNGFYRYSGRYVHTVAPCGLRVPSLPGTHVFCGLVRDHDPEIECRVIPAVRYVIG